jgi:hypothetical protein
MIEEKSEEHKLESLEDILKKPIPRYRKLQWRIGMYWHLFLNKVTFGWYHENWERVKYLFIIRLFGFKPIAYVAEQYFLEHTFVFETEEEATRAHKKLEDRGENKKSLVIGWWYGKEDFLEEVKRLEENMKNNFNECKDYKVEIQWLKK